MYRFWPCGEVGNLSSEAVLHNPLVFLDSQAAPWEPFSSAHPLCCVSSSAERLPSVTPPATPVAATAAAESAQDWKFDGSFQGSTPVAHRHPLCPQGRMRVVHKELLRWSKDVMKSSSGFMGCNTECSSSWNWLAGKMLPIALQMYIKYQPAGGDHRATANSDSVLLAQIFFNGKRVYCQMLRSSAMKQDLHWIRKALTTLVTWRGSVPVFKCYRGHTTAIHVRGLLVMMPWRQFSRLSRPPSLFR